MPFTPAHAAAAYPFRRTRLIFSALVVGCLAPDFEYYLRLSPEGHFGHTPAGLFLLDLPLGLLVLLLFHAYAKQPLWSWLPERMRVKIPLGTRNLPARTPAQVLLLCLSIVIGAATHIVWDSFTHHRYWPYDHLPFLRYVLVLPILGHTQVYNLLQHVSTVLGLLALGLWWMQWSRHAPQLKAEFQEQGPATKGRAVLGAAIAIAMGGALLRAWIGAGVPSGRRSAALFIVEVVITSITVFWIEVVAYGAVLALREKERRTR